MQPFIFQLHVGIYYESLCPDSVRFIENQLAPNYEQFADFIDIDFIPFGKSSSLMRANGVDFTCQHGPYECEGNKIQSCGIREAPNQDVQVQFVACQMSRDAEPSGQIVCGKMKFVTPAKFFIHSTYLFPVRRTGWHPI